MVWYKTIGSTSSTTSQYPHVNQTYSCNVWGLKLMHKKQGNKGYDQSVTCLADDLKTLVIRSSKPRTPETLSWTNNSIHNHSSKRCKGKTKKISKLKVQVKSFDLQKESIESELWNTNYDQKKFKFKSSWNQILNFQNHVQVVYLDRGLQDEDFGVGFTRFG